MNLHIAETVCHTIGPSGAYYDNSIAKKTLCAGLSNIKICRSNADLDGFQRLLEHAEHRTFTLQPDAAITNGDDDDIRNSHYQLMVDFYTWMNNPTDRMLQCGAFAVITGDRAARVYLEFACQVMIYTNIHRCLYVIIFDPQDLPIPNFFRSFFLRYHINETQGCSVSILNAYIQSVIALFNAPDEAQTDVQLMLWN